MMRDFITFLFEDFWVMGWILTAIVALGILLNIWDFVKEFSKFIVNRFTARQGRTT